MARIRLDLNFENDKYFEMSSKKDDEEAIKVIRCDENGNIKELWPYIERLCKQHVEIVLKEIGDIMKV